MSYASAPQFSVGVNTINAAIPKKFSVKDSIHEFDIKIFFARGA